MKTCICRACGAQFETSGKYAYYCHACRIIVDREQKRKRKNNMKHAAAAHQTIAQVAAEAKAHGLTYGRWVANNNQS